MKIGVIGAGIAGGYLGSALGSSVTRLLSLRKVEGLAAGWQRGG